jgi:hypothetical protein
VWVLTAIGVLLGEQDVVCATALGRERALQDRARTRLLRRAQHLCAAASRRALQRQRRQHALHVCVQHATVNIT